MFLEEEERIDGFAVLPFHEAVEFYQLIFHQASAETIATSILRQGCKAIHRRLVEHFEHLAVVVKVMLQFDVASYTKVLFYIVRIISKIEWSICVPVFLSTTSKARWLVYLACCLCYAEMVYTGLWRDAYKYNLGRIIRTYSLVVDRTLQNHTIYVLEEDHLYAYMVSV